MEPAASSTDMTADVGPLRGIPHALLQHIFPGLPLPTIMQLSRSSRDSRHAAQVAIPKKQEQLAAFIRNAIRNGCRYFTREQLALVLMFLRRFTGAAPVLTEQHSRDRPLLVDPDGTITQGNEYSVGLVRGSRRVYVSVFPRLEFENETLERLTFFSSYNKEDMCYTDYTYVWNKSSGRMRDRRIRVTVESCEGMEAGQALLLLFRGAVQADSIAFHGPIKSPCQCAAIILASRSTEWKPDGLGGSKRLLWETGREGPHLELVRYICIPSQI
eukprot:jgi/Botrbrau1/1638/Bobra.0185s0048.1